MEGQCAEGTGTEAATVTDQTELHLFNGRHAACLGIAGMPGPLIGQLVDRIHFFRGQRLLRGILHHKFLAVGLCQPLGSEGIAVSVLDLEGFGILFPVSLYFLKGGQHNGRQAMVMLKGVDSNFAQLTDIKNILIGDGEISLHDSINNYAIPGAGLVSTLNSGIYFVEPLEIYAPKRGKKVSLTNPASNFRKGYLHASGLIFALNQPKYDENYILTSIEFTREIFGRKENEATTLELKLNEGCNTLTVQNKIKNILGKEFIVENRYEQQKDIFKIMQIEKFISYIFLSFILLIACFNIIGSLSMLIIEKKKDVQTLRSLGANNQMITNIFISEGFLISLLGTLSGITIGVIICYAQQEFNLLTFGDSADSFIVNGYPVKIILEDILAVLVTVIVVGILSIGVPIKYLTQNLLKKIHD